MTQLGSRVRPRRRTFGGSGLLPLLAVAGIACIPLAGAGCSRGGDGDGAGGGAAAEHRGDPRDGGSAEGARTAFVVADPELVRRNNRGVGLMGRFAYEDARVIFAELAAGHPGWLDVRTNLAIATLNRQREGDEDAALAILEQVLVEDPEHPQANFMAGILHLRAGRMPEAAERLEVAGTLAPHDAYAAYFLAQAIETDDLERALGLYERSLELDPWLRSAYYRSFLTLRRTGDPTLAQARLDRFQALQEDPRARTAELVYTRMGPLAEAIPAGIADAAPARRPDGAVFADPVALAVTTADGVAVPAGAWRTATSITAADLDRDGRLDLFLTAALDPAFAPERARNAVLLARGEGFVLDPAPPFAHVPDATCAAWADLDGDGFLDLVLGRDGADHWWRGTEDPAVWIEASDAFGPGAVEGRTNDVLVIDADHDGDLDVLFARDGHDLFLAGRTGDGFDDVGAALGLAGDDRPTRRFVAGDFDGTRDLDLFALHDEPPHRLHRNERAWRWQDDGGGRALLDTPATGVVAADVDGDGRTDLVVRERGAIARWSLVRGEGWRRTALVTGLGVDAEPPFAVADVDGDGRPALVLATLAGPVVVALDGAAGGPAVVAIGGDGAPVPGAGPARAASAAALVLEDPARGPALAFVGADGRPRRAAAGPGRFDFTAVTFSGRTDAGQAMRSNASGIGTRVAARAGGAWSVQRDLPVDSGPGQSRQPLAIGLAGRGGLDYLAIEWSDGVFQSELPGLARIPGEPEQTFAPGRVERIVETQRQLSSCPIVFAWDGTSWRFVSDVLGVGGMGYLLEPGSYAPPRSWERFLLPGDLFADRASILDGLWQLKLHEPMEEAVYLDHAALVVHDLPPGWDVVVDDRMGLAEPLPTGAPVFFRAARSPVRATNDRGEDVTEALARTDAVAADPGPRDPRFLGRLERDHVLELEFDEALDAFAGAAEGGRAVLVADGWVDYPYSQTNFAAWQAGAGWNPPTVEARGADGRWRVVLERFGYPGGMPRTMSVPLDGLPVGTRALRISGNVDLHWDRIAVVRAEPVEAIEPRPIRREIAPASATLARTGFPRRSDLDGRRPHYDYADRAPSADMRYQAGWYTAFGDVHELVRRRDDHLVVYGPGEEVHLGFAPPVADPPDGWTRRVILDVVGWCKDMDLFTDQGDTVEPLPSSDGDAEAAERRHRATRTRFQVGP